MIKMSRGFLLVLPLFYPILSFMSLKNDKVKKIIHTLRKI